MATKKIASRFCKKCGNEGMKKDGLTTNVGSQKQRYRCNGCGFKTTAPCKTVPKLPNVVPMRDTLPVAKRYIITSAQNATPVHKPTWKAILQAAAYYDAELVVIPGRYKNPTSQWTQNNKDHEWWAPEVAPYLYRLKQWTKLNERLVLAGDMKVEWAAHAPLNGMDGLTKDRSGIIGHGSRAMRTIPTPQHRHPKQMYTTGTVTERNYTDTKRGRIADFNHCLGGLLVELNGDTFHVRELNATKNGSFIDLDLEFTAKEVRLAPPALALAMGDSHIRWIKEGVVKATFTAPDSMMKLMTPRNLFWHDVIDFHSRNWHHENDPVTQYAKWKFGKECVRTEIEEGMAFVNEHTPDNCEAYVVSSNHERGIKKWLKTADWKKDPVNADLIIELQKMMKDTARMTRGGVACDDPFIFEAKKSAKPNVRFLELGESKVLADVEYTFHGDIGPNGSRGTTRNLSKLGVKVTKAHNHTAEIIDGCYSVGKSTGMLEYEEGSPSSHSNTHAGQYANGKRAMFTIINERYCLPRPKKPLGPQRVKKPPAMPGVAA